MSVVRLDRSFWWSQFAFLLDMSLESSTFCDVVHGALLRFGGETLVFLVRYQYHFLHGRELTTFNRWTIVVALLCRAFSLSRLFVDILPKTLSTFLYFFSLFLSDGDRMILPLMTLWMISLRAFSCDLSMVLNNACLCSLRVVRNNSKKWSCCSRSLLIFSRPSLVLPLIHVWERVFSICRCLPSEVTCPWPGIRTEAKWRRRKRRSIYWSVRERVVSPAWRPETRTLRFSSWRDMSYLMRWFSISFLLGKCYVWWTRRSVCGGDIPV